MLDAKTKITARFLSPSQFTPELLVARYLSCLFRALLYYCSIETAGKVNVG
jgi:hypothetical protein